MFLDSTAMVSLMYSLNQLNLVLKLQSSRSSLHFLLSIRSLSSFLLLSSVYSLLCSSVLSQFSYMCCQNVDRISPSFCWSIFFFFFFFFFFFYQLTFIFLIIPHTLQTDSMEAVLVEVSQHNVNGLKNFFTIALPFIGNAVSFFFSFFLFFCSCYYYDYFYY